jgi:LPS sulfotransferase NodH
MYLPKIKNNVHLEQLSEYFGDITVHSEHLEDDASYVFICFTSRSGSNYFSSMVAENVNIGHIGEVFNFDTVIDASKIYGLKDFTAYFRFIKARYQRSGTVFFKTAISQIELLGRAGVLAKIAARSKFILVTRSDKLGQAISIAIAFATQQFTSGAPAVMNKEDVQFSRPRINAIVDGIAEEYRQWYCFFGRNGIVPITVNYESLVADPQSYFAPVAHQLGITEPREVSPRPQLERQSDWVNARWRELYLGDQA